MRLPPAVIVHGRTDADTALVGARAITLLSAPGAGVYAGCLWWRALVVQVRAAHPGVAVHDLLDCADASGLALAALRVGLHGLVLAPEAPGRERVATIAAGLGATLLPAPPDALDMAERGAARRLHDWLQLRTAPGDSGGGVR